MAHQMLYTSAARGLENRAGFQFVAASPGATPAIRQAASALLAYRRPPSAPSRPSVAERDALPVGYAYQRTPDLMIMAECRYLGMDYSGRQGNFLGHAVVASADQMEGMRPIELWRSALWATRSPDPDSVSLPDLVDLTPGDATAPEQVAEWLGRLGDPARPLLAELIDATRGVLAAGDQAQLLLVGEHEPAVAMWIAAISYSLPERLALDLSFVTYTADPDRATQRLVGITPDVWAAMDHADSAYGRHVFRLDQPAFARQPAPEGRPPTSRYAVAVADAWRRRDLVRIDELVELASVVTEAPGESAEPAAAPTAAGPAGAQRSQAAALDVAIELAEAPDSLAPAQVATATWLLSRRPADLPTWFWAAMAGQPIDRFGFDLALSLSHAAGRAAQTDLADRAWARCVTQALRVRRDRARLGSPRPLGAAYRSEPERAVDSAVCGVVDIDELVEVLRLARDVGLPVDAAAVRAGAAAVMCGQGNAGRLEAGLRALPEPQDRQAVLDGAITGLATADATRIQQALTASLCEEIVARDWNLAPRVGTHVLVSCARQRPDQRVPLTARLVALVDAAPIAANAPLGANAPVAGGARRPEAAPPAGGVGRHARPPFAGGAGRHVRPPSAAAGRPGVAPLASSAIDELIRSAWVGREPTVAECFQLTRPGVLPESALRRSSVLDLVARALVAGDIADAETSTLALRVVAALGQAANHPAAIVAEAVVAVNEFGSGEPAAGCARLDRVYEQAPRQVAAAAGEHARDCFLAAPPHAQAAALAGLPPGSRLRKQLRAAIVKRRRSDADLAEVAVRLALNGAPDERLTESVLSVIARPARAAEVRAALAARHPDLAAGLDTLAAQPRRPAWRLTGWRDRD